MIHNYPTIPTMKFPRYLLAISLLITMSTTVMDACGPYSIEDLKHIRFFRSCSPEQEHQWQDGCRFNEYEKEENCLLWQSLTSASIPLKDIEKVIYDASLSDIEGLFNGSNPKGGLSTNAFAGWLCAPEHREDLEYLLTAKEIEEIRDYMAHPWYYAYDGDEEHVALERLKERCLAYSGKRHAARYALQLVRLYFASGDYDECIRIWESAVSSMPRDIITDMTASYVGGAYYRLGDRDRAIDLYTRSQDIGSLISLQAWNYSEGKSEYEDARVRELEYIFNRFPESPLLGVRLQQYIRRLESLRFNSDGHMPDDDDNIFYDELKRFALNASSSSKCRRKGMWHYALGYLHYLDEDNEKARLYLRRAESADATPFIKESIHAFRFLIDAGNADGSPAYRHKLMSELAWLDRMMERDIKLTPDQDWQIYDKLNLSVFYWQDVAHKVLLGEVCPRLKSSGQTTLSIQLANYATNRIHQLSPQYNAYHNGEDDPEDNESYYSIISFDEYRRDRKEINWFDYSNQFFKLICSSTADEAARYALSIEKPASDLERFLNARGYVDNDYIGDIVGTLYIREMKYEKAEEWLSRVSTGYQARTNLAKEGYFRLDPFRYQSDEKIIINDSTDYRLRFAQEMTNLEKLINSDADPNRKAAAKLRYAIGLRNSFGRCWYLTSYGYSVADYHPDEEIWSPHYSGERVGFSNNPYAQTAYRRVDQLMKEAIKEFTDREQAAQALLEMKNFASLLQKYPESRAADYVRTRCDNLHDYALQKK